MDWYELGDQPVARDADNGLGYRRSAKIPITSEPMILDRNCRNTESIHGAAYKFYRGTPVQAPEIAGVAVEQLCANGIERQARAIGALVTRLIVEEKVASHDIAYYSATAV